MKPDIVYVVKQSFDNEELRYSLRSLEANGGKTYGKVIIIGGQVDGIHGDLDINIHQTGKTKYDKVNNLIREVCINAEVSDDFILMNDDFFIMKPVDFTKYKNNYRCSMQEYLDIIIERMNPSEYTGRLAASMVALEAYKLDTKCYELHIPMLFNKHKLLEVFGAFPGFNGLRTLYGNYFKIGGQKVNDCKVFTCGDDFVKSTKFLSTTDKSFRSGAVGEYIRSHFPSKSRFEH